MIDNQIIEQIRKDTNIVDVIGEYLPLTAKGKNFFGVCPFHDDHNPSMSVSPAKQIYTCFSCGATGNVFSFVMDYENIGFASAVRMLGEKLGITTLGDKKVKAQKKSPLYDVYEKAVNFYVNNLNTKEGTLALKYLESRNLSREVIKEFRIGLAVGESGTLASFLSQLFDAKTLEASGLIKDDYDIFRNRIIFPYDDLEGNVVGFSGRVYTDSDDAKYINTTETAIFKKGKLLFNYARAKNAIRLKKSVIVVEGVMDVIRLYSLGVYNVVAIMGTALTKEQLIILKRVSKQVYLCFDADAAGKKAVLSAIKLALPHKIDLRIMPLPEDDPDTYFAEKSAEDVGKLMDSAVSALDYKIMTLSEDIKPNNMVSIKKYIAAFKEDVMTLKDDPVLLNILLTKLSEQTGLDVDVIKDALKTKAPEVTKPIANVTNQSAPKRRDRIYNAEVMILFYMLQGNQIIDWVLESEVYFYNEDHRELFNKIIYYADQNQSFSLADFMTTIIDDAESLDLTKKVLGTKLPTEPNRDAINDCVDVITKAMKRIVINDLRKELKNEMNEDKKTELAEKILVIKKEEVK